MDFTKVSNLSTVKYNLFPSSNNITEEPLFKIHTSYLVMLPNTNTAKTIYNQFLTDLDKYSQKVSKNIPYNIYHEISKRNLIYLGKNSTNNNVNIPGMSILNSKKNLAGIILDMNTLGIDSTTGICTNLDLAFYSIYFEFIRNIITSNQILVNKDSKLDLLVIKILFILFLKILGSSITLNDKQKIFLSYDIAYFYFRFMKNQDHTLAISNALTTNDELHDETKFVLKTFEKYERMKDIFKSFIDFKIITESPAVMIIKTINKFNMFTFYCLTTSLDYLISMIVLSLYPTSFFTTLGVNNELQHELEKYLVNNYFNRISYDVNFLNNK